jgi:multidrug resistance efflux pump
MAVDRAHPGQLLEASSMTDNTPSTIERQINDLCQQLANGSGSAWDAIMDVTRRLIARMERMEASISGHARCEENMDAALAKAEQERDHAKKMLRAHQAEQDRYDDLLDEKLTAEQERDEARDALKRIADPEIYDGNFAAMRREARAALDQENDAAWVQRTRAAHQEQRALDQEPQEPAQKP